MVGFVARAGPGSTAGRSAFGDVHHQPDLALGRHRPAEHQDHVVHLLLLPRVGVGRRVGDEPRRALQQLGDDAQVVGPSELPVSVTSTMASASRGGLTSVAPQLNSTWAVTPCCASQRRVRSTTSVAMRLPCRSLTVWIGESLGTASTQRTGRRLTLLKTSSASSTTLASFSRIQS